MDEKRYSVISEIKSLFAKNENEGYYPLSTIVELSSETDSDGEEVVSICDIVLRSDTDGNLCCADSSEGDESCVLLDTLPYDTLKGILFSMKKTIEDKSTRKAVTRRWLSQILKDYKLNSNLI